MPWGAREGEGRGGLASTNQSIIDSSGGGRIVAVDWIRTSRNAGVVRQGSGCHQASGPATRHHHFPVVRAPHAWLRLSALRAVLACPASPTGMKSPTHMGEAYHEPRSRASKALPRLRWAWGIPQNSRGRGRIGEASPGTSIRTTSWCRALSTPLEEHLQRNYGARHRLAGDNNQGRMLEQLPRTEPRGLT